MPRQDPACTDNAEFKCIVQLSKDSIPVDGLSTPARPGCTECASVLEHDSEDDEFGLELDRDEDDGPADDGPPDCTKARLDVA